jgi:hypothetical protein
VEGGSVERGDPGCSIDPPVYEVERLFSAELKEVPELMPGDPAQA